MTPKSYILDTPTHEYLMAHAPALDAVQLALIEETAALGGIARMQIAPEQGALMASLTAALGASNAIEIGTFTGYSALCVARALPPAPHGHLLCLDVSEEWTNVAQRYWEAAGLTDRIELQLGPAADSLRALPEMEQFDIAFIDADKGGYATYFEELVPRMRRNAVILVDNVLWQGEVTNPANTEPDTVALRAFNDLVAADDRVESVILPIADGLTFIRKR